MGHLHKLVRQLQPLSQTVILFFDEMTPSSFREEAQLLTDDSRTLRHRDAPHEFVADMLSQCPGDFVLRLNDDELLSPNWTRRFVEMSISEQDVNSYWIARKWLVNNDGSYISSAPHYPDYQLRLTRNVAALLEPPRLLHEPTIVKGECGWISSHAILHYDLLWNDRGKREAKVERYSAIRPGKSGAVHYLYEDQPHAIEKAEQGGPFRAETRLLDQLKTMVCGREYWLRVVVNNRSDRVFNSHARSPIRLAYHWLHLDENDSVAVWDGERTPVRLPVGLNECLMRIIAPEVAGMYRLQVDLVEEFIAWFSETETASASDFPRYDVEIRSADREL